MQNNRKTRMTRWFFSRGSRASQHASPHCIDSSLGGSVANWHHLPSPHIGHCKNLPTSEGSSMTCFTRVALRGSRGASTMPLTKLFSGAPHKLLTGFNGDHATKPSRRWQLPRVTSTTGLQLDHLLSLDATSQCNVLESHSLTIGSHSYKHKWVRGFPSTPQAWTLSPKGVPPAKCPSSTSILAPKTNRVVGAKLHFLRGHRTRRWWHCPRGGGTP
jgi:hypothetical protein